MLTYEQFLLTKIAEEASEVAKIALKAQQFGLTEVQPGREQSNAERMYAELNDLATVVRMLTETGGGFNFVPCVASMETKRAKVNEFLHYSRLLGQVEDSPPVSLAWVEGLMDSMNMELATVSEREVAQVNGHELVAELRHNAKGHGYAAWFVDGKEMLYYHAVVTVMRPRGVPSPHTEVVPA
jgi:hypothetical protein